MREGKFPQKYSLQAHGCYSVKNKTLFLHRNQIIIYKGCAKVDKSSVESFLKKFGYVIVIGRKFVHNKFQGSDSKNDRFSGKKLFLQ